MLVAIYARHSTDRQCTSTRDQIDRCRRYCESKGYTVADVFCDEAVSGAHVTNRPGIRNLMTAAVEGYFERVITEDLSRISRDQGDTSNFFKKMAFLDIAVETVAEGAINELHIGFKSTMNALYLKDLADKTRRGMIASVLRGAVPGGRTYGYDIVHRFDERGEPIRGMRRINEEEAEVVRQIFQDYADGKTLKRICADLNALDIPSPNGGAWASTSLVGTASRKTGMLRQTLYKGVVTFNRMAYRKHPETGRRLSVVRPESEWISVPIPELAILDEKLFDRVQNEIEQRSSMRRQRILTNQALTRAEKAEREAKRIRAWRAKQAKDYSRARFIFSGSLYCGRHGEKMVLSRARVWKCSVKGCPNHNIRFETILPLVLDAAERLDEQAIQAHFDSPEVAAERARHDAAIADLKTRAGELRAEIRNLLSALGQHPRTAEIKEYLNDKERMLRRLRLDIEKHQRQIKALSQPPRMNGAVARFHKTLAKLRKVPLDRKAHAELRPLFHRFDLLAEWDDEAETWRRDCTATFDYPNLLRLNED